MLAVRTEPTWVFHHTALDPRVEHGHALIVEGNFAAYKYIKYDTKTPNIYFWTRVHTSIEQLRCSEVQRATEGVEVALGCVHIGKAKINDFDIAGFRNENVLDFEVAVHYIVSMAVLQCTANLASECSRRTLT